jgi:hypothetical protein
MKKSDPKTGRRSRSKKRRHVYPYRCKICDRKRLTFHYERAKEELCTKCEVTKWVDENQPTLL